jgi:hypothetical protein
MRRIVHVRTGERDAGAEIDDWIRSQPALAELFDDALEACLHVALRRGQLPALVWIGAARLFPQEGELLHYIALGWPGCPTVLYGGPLAGGSTPPGVLRVHTHEELSTLLQLNLDALLARLNPSAAPSGGSPASLMERKGSGALEAAHRPAESAGTASPAGVLRTCADVADPAPRPGGTQAAGADISPAGTASEPPQNELKRDRRSAAEASQLRGNLRQRVELTPEEVEALLGDSAA